MASSPVVRRDQDQYQPPLPWKADAGLTPAHRGRRTGSAARRSTTKGRRSVARRRDLSPAVTGPRRSSPPGNQGWRLDEQTRRAGRQGVAAARAALAGAAGREDGRQADAA